MHLRCEAISMPTFRTPARPKLYGFLTSSMLILDVLLMLEERLPCCRWYVTFCAHLCWQAPSAQSTPIGFLSRAHVYNSKPRLDLEYTHRRSTCLCGGIYKIPRTRIHASNDRPRWCGSWSHRTVWPDRPPRGPAGRPCSSCCCSLFCC